MAKKEATAKTVTTAYENKHELEARIAGLGIALRQSQPEAIAHIECVLGAFIQSMETPQLERFRETLDRLETLDPETKEIVMLYGELTPDGETVCGDKDPQTGETVKSKRQAWRDEKATLEAQLQDTPDAPEDAE